MFETSCIPKHQEVPILQPVSNVSRNTLFEKLPKREVVLGISSQTLQPINERAGVTPGEAVTIEEATRSLHTSNTWHIERPKRLASSLFGRIINRRDNIAPKSILQIIHK